MHEHWIPIVMFIVLGTVIALYYYFRYRARAEMQQTVRVALERGQELSADLIDRLGEPKKGADADLRRGLIAVGIGISLGIFAVVLDEQDAIKPILASACLPLFIGFAYLALWKLNKDKERG